MEIGILGGGLAGVSLGYFLNEKGFDVTVLEKEQTIGGLCRSITVDGYTFDYGGSHIIFSKDKTILDFMAGILGDNKVLRRRNTKIFFKNRFVKYPFENGLSDLPKEDNFECLYYFIMTLIEKEKGISKRPKNFLEWCYYTFGKGIAEKYLIPYNKKIWKYPLDKISLEWVERVPNPPIEDIIKSSLGIPTEGYIHQLYFYYPKYGGIESLVKSIARPIENKIITNFPVREVKKKSDHWLVSSDEEKLEFDRIISAMPIFELVKAYKSTPDTVRAAVQDLKYNSIITVMLGLDVDKLNDFSWLYIPQEDVITHRVSFPSNYSEYVAPKGKSSVLAEITLHEKNHLWKEDDSLVAKRVIEDLNRIGLIEKETVELYLVKRQKYAYVINDLNYSQNTKIFRDFFSKKGIGLVGRFSEFKYLNMDATIKSALNFVKSNFV
ncbi:MAG: protoporphyrinogen/coproporphyrinogen oxidase [Candidatus Asgardarchaeia archaeon]